MPPAPVEQGSSAAGIICSGSCTLQVVLGCVLPLLAVASWIPIMMIRRHLASKSTIQRSLPKPQVVTPRAIPTPRPPLTSVYVARVDYYVPTSQTGCMRSVAEGSIDESNHCPETKGIEYSLPCPELSPIKPSLPTLPSLSSMLNEFTAYADAIEPQFLTETKRSSTCLLDSVSICTGDNALSLTELPVVLSVPRVSRLVISTSSEDNWQAPPTEDDMVKHEDEKGRLMTGTSSMICEANSVSCLLVEELAADSSDEKKGPDGSHFSALATDVSPADPDESIEEISTSQLLPTRSTISFIVDSMSTLASMLALRLAEFPPVPPLPPPSFASAYIVHRRSELSSLGSAHSRSISVPASLNLLDIRPEDVLCQKKSSESRFIGWPSFSNPGELWDEEDDVVFSLRLPPKRIDLSKPMRHTWTAGITHDRTSDKGDLWDEDDDRRFSCIVDRKELQALVLASMPTFNFGTTNECIIGFSTARRSELQSLEKQVIEDVDTTQESADQTLCDSEPDFKSGDSGFAEDVSCADFDFASVKGRLFEDFPSQPSLSSSASLGLDVLQDLAADHASVYLSESSRSSLMSLASVLENTIRIVNPDHTFENLEGVLEVLDMGLESDCSYSSKTVSVTLPLVRDACPL